ncbi:FMN-dependent NADH-azoreductase [Lachnospiraceae bacterium KM106-2]|nr:FMN-dependent NADH-azoreductase [Lachnospiraceae bacterium KM106-2]
MSKVLYIKANAKPDGTSRTFQVSDSFVDTYQSQHPEDEIITLDLYKEGIRFLQKEDLALRGSEISKDHPVYKYAYQFAAADKYIIAAPFWNLSFPAILKAYIDYVSVAGITFKYTANGPVGLLQDKKAIHIVGRGGLYSNGPAADFEMGDRYLKTIFGFLGITDFTTLPIEKLDVVTEDSSAIVADAMKSATAIAKSF